MKIIQSEENISKILDLTATSDQFSGNMVETLASDLLKIRRAVEALLKARRDDDTVLEKNIINRLHSMLSFE